MIPRHEGMKEMTDTTGTAIKELTAINDDGLIRSLLIELSNTGHVHDAWIDAEISDKYGPEIDRDTALRIRDLLEIVWHGEYTRDWISTTALDLSLCPMHFVDYAACFDDDMPDCAAIRACFPSHDT